ncbi:MAG: DUF2341 domain-containing protein [Endomicrobiales bacterium]|nr:DUF2341 domain-containing protein [Endomicrobiales bacterium]
MKTGGTSPLKSFILALGMSVLMLGPAAGDLCATFWTEDEYAEFSDGYFYLNRSTASYENNDVRIKQIEDWYDLDWMNRRQFSVDNTAYNQTLTNYQVTLTVNTENLISANKMREDMKDIRFTSVDGETEIPFYIATSSGTATKIIVKIPNVSPYSTTVFYMYYNNLSTATSPSSRSQVYDLYEDWESESIGAQWSTGGNANFSVVDSSSYAGGYSARSGTIANSQVSYIQTTLNLEMTARVTFYWAVSSEGGGDYDSFSFYIDGIRVNPIYTVTGEVWISGEQSWNMRVYSISAGPNRTLKWEYKKDAGNSGGLDTAWLDNVVVAKSTNLLPSIVEGSDETFAQFYTEAIYQSSVLDSGAEQAEIQLVSWSVTLNGGTGLTMKMRASDTLYLKDAATPSWTTVTNNVKPTMSKGRYIQYQATLFGDSGGTTTPYLVEVTVNYGSPPTAPTNFAGVALSSTNITWSWDDNSSGALQEDGFRIYSSTGGIIADLAADTIAFTETGLQPNTQWGRWVGVYNSTGTNLSNSATTYTLAHEPAVHAEEFFITTDGPPNNYQYNTIPVQSDIYYSTFNFTSDKSTTTIEYYRVAFTTATSYTLSSNDTQWSPTVSTITHETYGNTIVKKAEIVQTALFNATSYYFYAQTYNAQDQPSGLTVLGPYNFQGCPANITDLTARASSGVEGAIVLTWTAPSADGSRAAALTNGSYIIKARSNFLISTESDFDNADLSFSVSTSAVAGEPQSFVISGLTPASKWGFAIKSVDSDNNCSGLSTNIIITTDTLCYASKIAKIAFITSQQTTYVGKATSDITIQTQDANGNPIKVTSNALISLNSTSATRSFGQTGVWGLTTVTIPAGQSQATFQYRDSTSGTPTITADETPSAGWAAGEQVVTVNPAKAVQFTFEHDSSGSVGTDENVILKANDGYGSANVSEDYRGVVIVTCTVAGVTVNPSDYMLDASDLGQVTLAVGNKGDNSIAGPAVFTVTEVVDQDYRDVLDNLLVGDEGMVRGRDDSARWFLQRYSSGAGNGFFGMASPDGTNIWASGSNGLVYKSTDSGETWYSYSTTLSETLYGVYFVDVSTGWAVGAAGKIVKSTDSGFGWSEQTSNTAEKLNSVYFVNLSTGWAVGDNGAITKTVDSGANWAATTLGTENLNRVYFFDDNNGYVVGDNGTIYNTANGGVSWSPQTSAIAENLRAVDFVSVSVGFIAGDNRTVMKTINGGSSWTLSLSTAATPDFYGVSFVGTVPDKVTAVGTSGSIYYTENGGTSWTPWTMTGTSSALNWNALVVSSAVVQATRLVQGRTNQGVRVALRTMYSGSSSVSTIRVKKSAGSTCDDTDITSIKVYRDVNGDKTYDASDLYLGEAALSSGKATISVSRTLTTTTDYWFIMPQVALTPSGLGKTFGISLEFVPDTDRFLGATGVLFAQNGLPFTMTELEIIPSSCTLSVGVGNISPSEVKQGQRDVTISSFTMVADRGETPWREFVITRNGINNIDSDIEAVNVLQGPSLNIAEATVIGTAAFGTQSPGVARVTLSPEPTITNSATSYFFVTADISPTAVYYTESSDARFWLSFAMTTSYFLLDAEGANGVSSNVSSFTSNQIRIRQAADTLVVTPVSQPAFDVEQSKTVSFIPAYLYVSESGGRVDITKIHVINSGTASDSDISSVSFWRDVDGNGSLNTAVDAELGSTALSSKEGDVVLTLPETITSQLASHATYFIAAAVSKTASVDSTVILSVNAGGITLAGADTVSSANFPLTSNAGTIKNFRDTVNVTFTSLAPREARVDEAGIAMAKIDLWAYCSAQMTKITFEYTGTGAVTSVSAVYLYRDSDGDGTYTAGTDALLGSGTFAGDGKCDITFAAPPTVYDSSYTVIAVYDFNGAATPQKTAGIALSDSSLIFPGESGANAFGYYQSSKVNLLNKETPSVPVLQLKVEVQSGIQVDGETVYFYNQSTDLEFNWESTALNGIAQVNYGIASFDVFSTTDVPDVVSWQSTSLSTATLSNANLKHNTAYYLWVKAVSTDGYERVTSAKIKIDLTSPGAPGQPTDTSPKARSSAEFAMSKAPTPSAFWVSWAAADDEESGVLYYELQERTGTSPVWHTVSTTTATDYRIQKDTATDTGKFFYYQVRAKNYAGSWGSYSEASSAAYLSLPPDLVKDLATYPNPFDSRRRDATVTFLLNQDATVELRIYDLFGGLVKEWKMEGTTGENRSSWDGTDSNGQKVAAGMYIMHVETKTDSETEKKRWKIGVIH